MYRGVPATDVNVPSPEGALSSSGSVRSRGAGRASPKSATRGRPSSPMSTLSGLKSRCTSPARWAACSPRPAATNMPTTSRQLLACAASQRRSVGPSTNSIARNTASPSTPTS